MKLIKLWEADLEKAYRLQTSFGPNENGFINSAYGYTLAEFLDYVKKCENTSLGIDLPENYVPATVIILENDGHEYVGIFNLRHKLNESLRNGAGHIGYGISPDYRKKGYATQGLALVLQEAKKIGIDEALLSVNKKNLGSLKAQQKNGATIYREDEKEYYTKIKLM